MTAEQQAALENLRAALAAATNCGLLDLLQNEVTDPDAINDVCDACETLAA